MFSFAANWTPKFDGNLRPRAGLVYVEPNIYDEVLKEEKRIKKAFSQNALSSRTGESTIGVLSPVMT